jgi:hypothetical protein
VSIHASLGALLLGTACVGTVGGANDPDDYPSGDRGAGKSGGGAPQAAAVDPGKLDPRVPPASAGELRACAAAALPGRRVVRLSDRQYRNAARELVGLLAQVELTPLEAVRTPGGTPEAFLDDPSLTRVEHALAGQYQRAAEAIGVVAAERWRELMPCPEAPSQANTCVRGWIESFVGRAVRRPLIGAEIDDYARVYTTGAAAGVGHGVRLVTTAVLQSPSFLYRTELGGAPAAAPVALTDHELAAQLGLWLRDSLPDAALWRAAQTGQLSDPAGLRREVERLLGEPTVKQNLTAAFLRWFELPRLVDGVKDATRFPWFAAARGSYLESARLFVADALWSAAEDAGRLYGSSAAFVDPRMARAYGLPAPVGAAFTRMEAPAGQRAGLITHPAFLAAFAGPAESQVVQRGVFIRRDLLCQDLMPPPPGLDVDPPRPGLTERQFAEHRAGQAACKGCHALIDPFGLLLESYDAVGVHRTTTHGQAIDPVATVVATDFDGRVGSAVELAKRMSASRQVSACLVRHMVAHALARAPNLAVCTLDDLATRFEADGRRLTTLLTAIALSPEFRWRAP